ncbi:hypothetical protein WBG83_18855 [Paenibacillus sp. y28]
MVTATFYSALHLVDEALQKRGKRVDDHKQRNQLVIADGVLGQEIADAYRSLFNESMAARYFCLPVTKNEHRKR